MEDSTAKIISAVMPSLVGVSAMIFAYLQTSKTISASKENLEKQLKIQLATTVEKDWAHNVRSHVSIILYQTFMFSIYSASERTDKEGFSQLAEISIKELFSSDLALSVLLNDEIPSERDLKTAMGILVMKTLECKTNEGTLEIARLSKEIPNMLHKVWKDRNATTWI